MKIVIYGADVTGRIAFDICKKIGFNVIAFIDADTNKTGKNIDNILILGLDNESEQIMKSNVVMMGTHSKEAYDYVNKFTDNIIDINIVTRLYGTFGDKNMPKTSLKSIHLQNCTLLPDRIELLHNLPKEGIIAEVGVCRGDYSKYILDICKPKKLYLIDLWETEEFDYSGNENYETVYKLFKDQITSGQVELIKMDSVSALSKFEDKYLDMVYLDTVHDYITPHNELEIAKDKVKDTGIICGHDYAKFNVYAHIELGVWSAVNEFVMENSYEFRYLTHEEHGLQSYAIMKL